MDFQLSDSQRALQETARKYAREVVRPKAAHHDETAEFPKAQIATAHELGLINMAIPQEYNGLGLSHLEQVIVCEELSWGDASVATTIVANDLANLPIILAGTSDQKRRLLSPFTEKLKFASFCLTEPGAGSDVAGLSTTARLDGDHYVLNGSKCFITNGTYAEQYTVFATVDKDRKHKGISCFVVEGQPPGLTIGKHENKMGQRASNTVTLTFEDVRVPVANRIGEEGQGFLIAMETLDNSRPLTAMFSVGIARAALEHSLEYSSQRRTFGKAIREHQGVQFMLADMGMNIQAARLLTYQSALLLDEGQKNTLISSYAKCFAADMAMKVTTDAVQVYGGYGYIKEYPVEKLMRDAKLIQIYEGTSQVQRLVIARELFK
ncbi:acyl-CoA dehydrogenase family protein [Stigmatella aurantiaca]|uniref:Acyl-CoA dehydrogenase n=1 Tax=Stigmatella aurantiaca (strain DW4/3-1) TaxID=378806 RepID=Q09C62_STIAD|nr:acyl-CoA dehydrogenase family protein [Stigmatella aurantiaca]ADO74345.1 Acyl-CoA dehydrogenase [Stigmatella aurantiaca DW4/3-1]EAU69309.1 acyl-CoA dehydrogenase, medium-chain specific [Stigmatella aurantiaca DW4/3-1]